MDFDLDDPLGDLLSEGSNDSFFGDGGGDAGSSRKSTNPKKSSAAVNDIKSRNKMENLFGIKDTTPGIKSNLAETLNKPTAVANKTKQTLQQISSTNRTEPLASSTPKKQISFDEHLGDNNDFLSDLGFDPKKPKSTLKSSSNIFDDLLGISDVKSSTVSTTKMDSTTKNRTSAVTALSQTSSNSPLTDTTIRPKTSSAGGGSTQISRQSTFDKNNESDSFGRPRTANTTPVSRRKQTTNVDPLGFNEDDTKKSDPSQKTKPTLKKSNVVDWLGLGNTDESFEEPTVKKLSKQQQQVIDEKDDHPIQSNPADSKIEPIALISQSGSLFQSQLTNVFRPTDITQGAQLLQNVNIDTENALQSLKQQEMQLMIASQMKNQESVLLDMQQRQHELLKQQEIHFNDLLQKQIQRQCNLEENIKNQQERINSHIQILLTQPQSTVGLAQPGKGKLINDDEHSNIPINFQLIEIELKADIKKLELEKLRLEDLIHSVKINHEHELEFLEQSYRKQIAHLEQTLEKLENRYVTEITGLEEYFKKKLANAESENQQLINNSEQKLSEMEKAHLEVMNTLKIRHTEELENLKLNHLKIMENYRESKLLEFSLLQENTSYLSTLKSAVNFLESSTGDLQVIRNDLQDKIQVIHANREMELNVREKRLAAQQEQLDKVKEQSEMEKNQLLELVKALETKLNSVLQSSSEEQWSLRQQRGSLEAERISFEREKEFLRETNLREEKKLQELKTYQITEYERRMNQLNDDRNEILSEKAKLEMRSRLQKTSEVHVSKNEIEAAVKVAQDATRQADVERERFVAMQRDYEIKKRELIDHENNLRSRECELDASMNSITAKERSIEQAVKLAQITEQKYMTRMQLLQKQFNDLSQRESKLAEQKLEMSRERLELQSLRNKLYKTRCSLCKIDERSQEISDLLLQNGNNNNNHLLARSRDQSSAVKFINTDNDNPEPTGFINNLAQISNNNYPIAAFSKIDNLFDNEIMQSLEQMEHNPSRINVDLENVPDITDISDDQLDPDLLLLKFDILNGQKQFLN